VGKNNQQRRKAKAKARKQQRGSGSKGGTVPPQFDPNAYPVEARARLAVVAALQSVGCECGECEQSSWLDAAAALNRCSTEDGWSVAVSRMLDDLGDEIVAEAWQRGWMPRDVLGTFTKELNGAAVRAAALLMRSQLDRYSKAQLSDRWNVQRDELIERVGSGDISTAGAGLGDRDRQELWAAVLEALDLFQRMPELPRVEPLPGSPSAVRGTGGAEASRVYEKIRALLAKAESTDSEAEAEAFTAKAQQLIARHSISEALLARDDRAGHEPEAIRVHIERPYEQPKSELLGQIALANHCRPVYWPVGGFTTIIGDRADLRSVELLYNSLLVQSTAAMTRAGSLTDNSGRSRTRSFRQSFLASFAVRIGERLRESAADTAREMTEETGTDLVPVMRSRDENVDAKTEELFPNLTFGRTTRISNYQGHVAGRAAADAARLHSGESIDAR
jgi:hypothetical protein